MESQAPMVNQKAVGSQTAMEEPTPMCPSTVVHVQASAATSKSNHEGEDNEVIKRQSSWPKRVPPGWMIIWTPTLTRGNKSSWHRYYITMYINDFYLLVD